ncbi:MAG: hypothetical protein JOY96_00895 [Verrucomicrobia bacterium]|nr:hypothetical protein [Verrucomicrobiota bacterium]MBV9673442.1 hypothetical protein [Verrucomicrobiota bacterium]
MKTTALLLVVVAWISTNPQTDRLLQKSYFFQREDGYRDCRWYCQSAPENEFTDLHTDRVGNIIV